jgi:hypothetical protein
MEEKLALLKIALCSASVFRIDSAVWRAASSGPWAGGGDAPVDLNELGMGYPD